jgi:hypothetical protein
VQLIEKQIKTPKALANSSPGFEGSENPGIIIANGITLKALGLCDINPFRVESMVVVDIFPGLSNPGLQLANAFGVIWAEISNALHGNENCITTQGLGIKS